MNRLKLFFGILIPAVAVGAVFLLSHQFPSQRMKFVYVQPTVSSTPAVSDWKQIDAEWFLISLPPNWNYTKLQGIDSYVGEFSGDGVTLSFDFGSFSNSLVDASDPDYTVTFETIDSQQAKLVVPKALGKGMVGVYFGSLSERDRLTVEGTDLTANQQETALQIFRSIRFKAK